MKNLTKNTLLITLLFVSFCFCACDNEKKNEIEAKIKILNTEILDLKNESENLTELEKTENSFIELEKNAIELITDKKEKSEAYKKLASRLYEKANKHGRIAKLLDRKQSEIDSLKSLLK
jgi:DNA repair exonuclease SbcCD ATPase subunit